MSEVDIKPGFPIPDDEETFGDDPICPACGHTIGDPYEYFERGNEVSETECPNCDAPIEIVQHVSVDYTTSHGKNRKDQR